MKTVSWILLTVAAALTLLGSVGSLGVAYFAAPTADQVVPGTSVQALGAGAGHPEITTSLRARRGTAAAYAIGYAVLLLVIVLVPYRRGEVWAWWAVLAGALTVFITYALRLPTLGTRQGLVVPAAVQLGVMALGLLLDAGRLSGPKAS
jgi:peptidoglycan/LPS O-acetylase OafA/YrhL